MQSNILPSLDLKEKKLVLPFYLEPIMKPLQIYKVYSSENINVWKSSKAAAKKQIKEEF